MQTEKIVNYIEDWMSQYLQSSRQKGFVIGISGGIDSAVVSTLCAKTGYPLLCLEMPIHQKPEEAGRAGNHIRWLENNFKNASSRTIDLTSVFDIFSEVMKPSGNEGDLDLTLANTRARIRMAALYYCAGLNHFIVAGTGNKIEDFGVGFFTKYGDGGVDISPIGDLMKSEVRMVAEYLGIDDEILRAKPTDGLFEDNRSDEDQIGAAYEELEWAMKMMEAGKKSEDFSGHEQEVFEIFINRNKNNLHKMLPIPICRIPYAWK